MSLFAKQVEFLSYVERLQGEDSGLTFRFLCRCVCETSYPEESPYPLWRIHRFDTVTEVRGWLEGHKGHECYISLQTEGIRPRSRGSSLPNREGRSRHVEVVEKLKALADNTPYITEAEAAWRKIRELEGRARPMQQRPR